MAIVLKNCTFSGNGSDLSVPVGTVMQISCPSCGYSGSQNGRGKTSASCPNCGSTEDLRIEFGKGVVLDTEDTNEFKDCTAEDGARAAISGQKPAEGEKV